jgi:hypothetical protein
MRPWLLVVGLAAMGPARAALAHHGVAAVSVAGPEGPGAALDTTSPLPLPQGLLFAMMKSEYVPFQQRPGFPDQKAFSWFNLAAVGYGALPWLSAYVFQPYNTKAQDGLGRNTGVGDTSLMLAAGFKLDEGLRLVPEKESLDELEDWHFSLWSSCTLPVGPTTHRGHGGVAFAPDMQTGFGSPSPAVGLAVAKQLAPAVTALAELNYQHFFTHDYGAYRYRFGGETRLNGALVVRALGAGAFRLDLTTELGGLNLRRDQSSAGTGTLAAQQASGGAILYGTLGLRATYGSLSLALGAKRALVSRLNEGGAQQGSEGLEVFRGALTLGYSTRL